MEIYFEQLCIHEYKTVYKILISTQSLFINLFFKLYINKEVSSSIKSIPFKFEFLMK